MTGGEFLVSSTTDSLFFLVVRNVFLLDLTVRFLFRDLFLAHLIPLVHSLAYVFNQHRIRHCTNINTLTSSDGFQSVCLTVKTPRGACCKPFEDAVGLARKHSGQPTQLSRDHKSRCNQLSKRTEKKRNKKRSSLRSPSLDTTLLSYLLLRQ